MPYQRAMPSARWYGHRTDEFPELLGTQRTTESVHLLPDKLIQDFAGQRLRDRGRNKGVLSASHACIAGQNIKLWLEANRMIIVP